MIDGMPLKMGFQFQINFYSFYINGRLKRFNYKNITPSLVKAVNLIPTGKESKADWSAICSFPFPDAIESATSNPSKLEFRF